MKKKDTVLRIERVNKSFGNLQVLEDLNLTIKEGEFLTLLGPSGSGKTTLLNIVAGFVTPDSGDIYIRGKRVNEVEPRKRHLGMVFQSWALFPHMDVFDNIAFGLKIKKYPKDEVKKRVNEVLELVKLSEGVSQKFPSQLSGGMQQRVALARAIVLGSNMILFDEPLSNLDARLRKEMRVELKKYMKNYR
ncbi:Oligosaccharides import ATP-binding protein MsmX [subsurface metagenome]